MPSFLAVFLEFLELLFKQCVFGSEILEELVLVLENPADDGEIDGLVAVFGRHDVLHDLGVAVDVDLLQLGCGVLLAVVLEEEHRAQLRLPQQDVALELADLPLDHRDQLELLLSAQLVYYQDLLPLRLVAEGELVVLGVELQKDAAGDVRNSSDGQLGGLDAADELDHALVEVLHLLGLLLFQMDVVEVGVGDPKTLRVVVERGDVDLLDVLDGLLLQDDVGLLLSLKVRVRMHT
jgi:hypothetical protein